MTQITALVPMRHHSQRVPKKNSRILAGKPLFHHILSTLADVPELDAIYVDTDSSVIAEGIGVSPSNCHGVLLFAMAMENSPK